MFGGWNYDGEPPLPPNLGQMMGQLGGQRSRKENNNNSETTKTHYDTGKQESPPWVELWTHTKERAWPTGANNMGKAPGAIILPSAGNQS